MPTLSQNGFPLSEVVSWLVTGIYDDGTPAWVERMSDADLEVLRRTQDNFMAESE